MQSVTLLTVRGVSGLAVALLLAGCLAPAHVPRTEPSASTAADNTPRPGLYTASLAGLQQETTLDGITLKSTPGQLFYSWNALATLADNSEQLILMQVLADANVSMHLDTHVAYDGSSLPGTDHPNPPESCYSGWGFNITANDTGAFYLGRSLGQDPQAPPPTNQWHAPGVGHGHGAGGAIVLYGDSFDSLESQSGRVPAGGWVLFNAGISQIPADAANAPGNWWWMNWTVNAPHRVIRLLDAPLYCYFGVGQVHDASQNLAGPIPFVQGGHLEVETRYGSTIVLRIEQFDATSRAEAQGNHAVVHFLDHDCLADAGNDVAQDSFKAGWLNLTVQQWLGYPDFVLSGLGPWQTPWGIMDGPHSCTTP